jgi:hypothetical protein
MYFGLVVESCPHRPHRIVRLQKYPRDEIPIRGGVGMVPFRTRVYARTITETHPMHVAEAPDLKERPVLL